VLVSFIIDHLIDEFLMVGVWRGMVDALSVASHSNRSFGRGCLIRVEQLSFQTSMFCVLITKIPVLSIKFKLSPPATSLLTLAHPDDSSRVACAAHELIGYKKLSNHGVFI